MIEKFFIEPTVYSDGVVELAIDNRPFPKAALSGFGVFEFSRENREVAGVKEHNGDKISGFSILAIPNPAKEKVQIHYQLPISSEINLKIYSVTGQVVRLINEKRPAGLYGFIWDGKDNQGRSVPNGVYLESKPHKSA